jgi:hypothetical protein
MVAEMAGAAAPPVWNLPVDVLSQFHPSPTLTYHLRCLIMLSSHVLWLPFGHLKKYFLQKFCVQSVS